jgi:transposase
MPACPPYLSHRRKMMFLAMLEERFGRRKLPKRHRKKYTRTRMQYWKKKARTGNHPNPRGGAREGRFKFPHPVRQLICKFLWLKTQENNTTKTAEYVSALRDIGINVSNSYVNRLFRSWGLSWKKCEYKHPNKFHPLNVLYYKAYIEWASLLLSWNQIKFLDESHFVNKGSLCCF